MKLRNILKNNFIITNLKIATGIVIVYIIIQGFTSCEKEAITDYLSGDLRFSLDSYSDCKLGKLTNSELNQECFQYSYSNDTLFLKHINAAFNCCPGEIVFQYTILNDVIIITEQEMEASCDCLCLYDLNYIIGGLPKGRYEIEFSGTSYLPLIENELHGEIDLQVSTSGEVCIDRNSYPWNE